MKVLPLEVTARIQRLVKLKLVRWKKTSRDDVPHCSLTASGRDYVCTRGLVLKQIDRAARRVPPTELWVSVLPHTMGIVQDVSEDGSGLGIYVDCAMIPGADVTIELDAKDRTRAFCARVVHCRPTSDGGYFVGLYIVHSEAKQRLQTRIGDLVTWKKHSAMPPA